MLATTGPRELLRVAIAERDEATETEANAARAVVRARQLLDDAEQTLALLAGVDDEISAHHAGAIKAWAADGGERPSGELPAHLAAKKALRGDAEARVVTARQAQSALNKELLDAAGRLQGRKAAAQHAAGEVLSAEAETIVDELRAARKTVWALEDKLRSLGAVLNSVRRAEAGRSNGLAYLTLPPISFAAVLDETAPMRASNVSTPYARALAKWTAWLQALQRDPDSSLDSI